MAHQGRPIVTVDVGYYLGPLRGYTNLIAIGQDVSRAILDFAETHDLLDRAMRPAWEDWVADVLALIADQPPAGVSAEGYLVALDALAARPLPPARTTRTC
jgi:hypothetical protein